MKVDNTLVSTIELLFYETDLARIASENSLISKLWAVKCFDTSNDLHSYFYENEIDFFSEAKWTNPEV